MPILPFRLWLLLVPAIAASATAQAPPNILWITAEDMSPALGCYGDTYAVTPHIDRLAAESVRYTHAFATSPVCSPVRSCLITGCYAQSMGTHNMRSAMPLPTGVRGFPTFLRQAGYYTSNNVKTDYNTSDAKRLISESWDESSSTAHWRNRKNRSQPFFSVFNLMTSHQSRTMVWPYEKFQTEIQNSLQPSEIHSSAATPLPPYYPDTPVVRREWARFYDCVTAVDRQVGDILQQLAEDGLADSTIVFFFSDHGSGMPRHKRALLDTGMKVPLLIRIPKKYRQLSPAKPGTTTNRLVSFVDFPATVLNLTGRQIPDYMQGQPFLGSNSDNERPYAFGHRDRVDEAFDCSRSVRSKRYLYIRNYMPHLSYNQPTAWPDQGQIRHEFYRLAKRSGMTDAQWHFAGPTKPIEELYDCAADPVNLQNLVGSDTAEDQLLHLRQTLDKHLEAIDDKGFVPETLLKEALSTDNGSAAGTPNSLFQNYRRDARTASLKTKDPLPHGSPYWDAIRLRFREELSNAEEARLKSKMMEPSDRQISSAMIEIAHTLVHHQNDTEALDVLIRATETSSLQTVLQATRAIELLGTRAENAVPAIRRVAERCESILPTATTATFVQTPEQDLAMFISFSAGAFLKKYDVPQ